MFFGHRHQLVDERTHALPVLGAIGKTRLQLGIGFFVMTPERRFGNSYQARSPSGNVVGNVAGRQHEIFGEPAAQGYRSRSILFERLLDLMVQLIP